MIKYKLILLMAILLCALSTGCEHNADEQILVLNNTDDTIFVAINREYPLPIKEIFKNRSTVAPPHRVAVIEGDWNKNYECQLVIAHNDIHNALILSQRIVTSAHPGWYSNIYLTYPEDFTPVEPEAIFPIIQVSVKK